MRNRLLLVLVLLLLPLSVQAADSELRPRVRDLGLQPGVLPPGTNNAITDVEGVRVGHRTLVRDERVRTGVTAIVPHGGNLFQNKVPCARSSLGREEGSCNRQNLKPFVVDPVGPNPTR